ncbi:MAG: hypothetical protein P8X82_05825, partial [Gemmatimonadales bacterium]
MVASTARRQARAACWRARVGEVKVRSSGPSMPSRAPCAPAKRAALGVVERVEPAPSALVRHLTASGVTDAVFVMADPHDRDCAVVGMRQGEMTAIRKVPSEAVEIAAAARSASVGTNRSYLYPWSETLAGELNGAGLSVEPVPAPGGSAERFAGAHGALLGIDGPEDLTFTSPTLARQHAARAWR